MKQSFYVLIGCLLGVTIVLCTKDIVDANAQSGGGQANFISFDAVLDSSGIDISTYYTANGPPIFSVYLINNIGGIERLSRDPKDIFLDATNKKITTTGGSPINVKVSLVYK